MITALLFSIVSGGISQINPTQKAYAQISSAATSACQKLPIGTVSASGNDGNLPANVLDNNPSTRWSNLGIGSWIQADLGSNMNICSVVIAWYNGNIRQNNFVISVSSDGTSFTNVFTGKSSGTTLSPETYILPGGTTGRYVRITVNGNTQNNWASITELSVDGLSSTNTNCTKQPIATVTASGNDGNLPANVLDNNLNTRWSNLGVGSFIQADLGGQKTICSVDIAWYRGNPRVNNFVISVSSDGTSFTNVFTGKSSGTTLSAEKYSLPTSVTTRFVRVTVNGNTENNWASITELSVDGSSNTPPHTPPTVSDLHVQTSVGTPLQITLAPDPGNVLTFSVIRNTVNGTLTSPAHNIVTYTPKPGIPGTDSFTFKATDNLGASSNIATVTITIAAPHTPPTANNIIIQTNKETPIGITLRGTGDMLIFSVVGNPTHGTVVPGTVSSNVFYTPTTGFTGPDSFTYKATDGQGVDSNIATVSITVSNATTGTLDQFGVKELYPSKIGAEHWQMNMQSEGNDPQFGANGVTLTKNADTTYKVMSSQVRLQIFPSTGFQENQIVSLNQAQLAAQGYMLRPNDWKNVEMTGYLKANSITGSSQNGAAHIEYVARGARNTNDQFIVGGFPAMCEATTYHSNTYLSPLGRVKFEKDLMHTAGYTANSQDPQRVNSVNIALGKWVGIKAVYYNFPNGTVKLEQWVDDSTNNINAPGNNWHKVLEFVDHGQWGGGHPNCGGTDHTTITWGGPIALFRWDNVDNMDIKNLSIREIQPLQ
ncbi:MAG: discoidin domain-containing protein [Thermoproteota archaeon]|nr:discoidin domain-containing protein [Thermoproteota archaeon]